MDFDKLSIIEQKNCLINLIYIYGNGVFLFSKKQILKLLNKPFYFNKNFYYSTTHINENLDKLVVKLNL